VQKFKWRSDYGQRIFVLTGVSFGKAKGSVSDVCREEKMGLWWREVHQRLEYTEVRGLTNNRRICTLHAITEKMYEAEF